VENKKREEIEIMKLFRKLYTGFPKAVMVPSESPDFILRVGPKMKIGVELTRLNQRSTDSDLFSYDNISACLRSKDQKLALYKRKKLQEYWLILYVRDPAFKPRYNLHNKLILWMFDSGFNRIFLFYMTRNKIYELKTSPGTAWV